MTLSPVIQFQGLMLAICKNRIFKYDSAKGNWSVVHVIFNDDQDRQLTLQRTIMQPPAVMVVGAGRDVWSKDGITWVDYASVQVVQSCKCTVKTLMQSGCKCGGA